MTNAMVKVKAKAYVAFGLYFCFTVVAVLFAIAVLVGKFKISPELLPYDSKPFFLIVCVVQMAFFLIACCYRPLMAQLTDSFCRQPYVSFEAYVLIWFGYRVMAEGNFNSLIACDICIFVCLHIYLFGRIEVVKVVGLSVASLSAGATMRMTTLSSGVLAGKIPSYMLFPCALTVVAGLLTRITAADRLHQFVGFDHHHDD